MGDHFGHPRGVHTIAMSGVGEGRWREEGRGEGGAIWASRGGGLVWANMGGLLG